jgi:hypothetical protein
MNNVLIKSRERELQDKKMEVTQQKWILILGVILLLIFIRFCGIVINNQEEKEKSIPNNKITA